MLVSCSSYALNRGCVCPRNHRHLCPLRNCWQTPLDFLRILKEVFALNREGMADALHHRPIFQKWCSEFQEDVVFGAQYDFFGTNLCGDNVFVNPPFNSIQGEDILMRVVDRCLSITRTDVPTRCVILIPVFKGPGGDRFLQRALQSGNAFVVMYFGANRFSFEPPDAYYLEDPKAAVFYHEIAIVLICSRTSLVFDPLDWFQCAQRLKLWATSRGIPVTIPDTLPLSMFKRGQLTPRRTYGPPSYDPILACMPYLESGRGKNFWIQRYSKATDQQASACNQLMKLDPVAAVLGIFPTGIRRLFLDKSAEEKEKLVNEWSLATFWQTWRIWRRRNFLVTRQRRIANDMVMGHMTCKSPFHFLTPLLPNPHVCGCPKPPSFSDAPEGSYQALASFCSGLQQRRSTDIKGEKSQTTLEVNQIHVPPRRSERLRGRVEKIVRKRKLSSNSADCEKKLTARRKRRK